MTKPDESGTRRQGQNYRKEVPHIEWAQRVLKGREAVSPKDAGLADKDHQDTAIENNITCDLYDLALFLLRCQTSEDTFGHSDPHT